MRSFISALVLASFPGTLLVASAQSTNPHSGFAVVTLVSGNVAGLISTETIRSQTGSGPGQAILAPSPLLTSASLLVPVGPIGDNTTAIAIANPSTGSGSTNLVLTDTLGNVLFNTTVFLGPLAQISRFLNDFFTVPPAGFSPALLLTVSSEIPVGIVALNFQGDAFTQIPLASLSSPTPVAIQPLAPVQTAIPTTPFVVGTGTTCSVGFAVGVPGSPVCTSTPMSGFGAAVSPHPVTTTFSLPATVSSSPVPTTNSVGGVGAVAFPQVVIGGNWSTEIAIGNTSAAAQVARVDFFNSSGAAIGSFTNIVIPPKGVISFAVADVITAIN